MYLEDANLGLLFLGQHRCLNASTLHHRRANPCIVLTGHQQDLIQHNLLSSLGKQFLYQLLITDGNKMLTRIGANNGINHYNNNRNILLNRIL